MPLRNFISPLSLSSHRRSLLLFRSNLVGGRRGETISKITYFLCRFIMLRCCRINLPTRKHCLWTFLDDFIIDYSFGWWMRGEIVSSFSAKIDGMRGSISLPKSKRHSVKRRAFGFWRYGNAWNRRNRKREEKKKERAEIPIKPEQREAYQRPRQ